MGVVIEAANPQHEHEWIVFKDNPLPDGKSLMPGILGHAARNFVEHPELVAQRICQFADIVGSERVIASSDCGFGTFAGYGKMDPGVAYAKLRALGLASGS
jgi:5-methyltetrahydropteroyltriglutamate--homocysteine methyltransferase